MLSPPIQAKVGLERADSSERTQMLSAFLYTTFKQPFRCQEMTPQRDHELKFASPTSGILATSVLAALNVW
jgi:hypothetical protein